MFLRNARFLFITLIFTFSTQALKADELETPSIPSNRVDLKRTLESLKERKPRIPLPDLAEDSPQGGFRVNNGRARKAFLPEVWYSPDFKDDPAMTLDKVFKVKLFWLVSRSNHCQYCLGHQEHKLAAAGVTDDEIASLDADWNILSPRDRLCAELAVKMTISPHELTVDDIVPLREHFTDAQIRELLFTLAFFNNVNRWTSSLGLPQDSMFRDGPIHLETPTSLKFASAPSIVAPRILSHLRRPSLESDEIVEQRLAGAKKRQSIVTLPSVTEARSVALQENPRFGEDMSWVRALADYPELARKQLMAAQAIEDDQEVSPALKARIAWTTARHNRSWYALGHAKRRLVETGIAGVDQSPSSIDKLSGTDREREAIRFAKVVTESPQTVSDEDIARLRKLFTDRQTAQIVYVACSSNWFDRFTESLQLPLEF